MVKDKDKRAGKKQKEVGPPFFADWRKGRVKQICCSPSPFILSLFPVFLLCMQQTMLSDRMDRMSRFATFFSFPVRKEKKISPLFVFPESIHDTSFPRNDGSDSLRETRINQLHHKIAEKRVRECEIQAQRLGKQKSKKWICGVFCTKKSKKKNRKIGSRCCSNRLLRFEFN